MTHPARICLATATTERFMPGTMVTVGSFLEHHPDCDGDVVVIEDGLPEECRARLRALCGRVRFLPVSPELRDRIARLGAARPDFRRALPRFFALDAFRLTGYRKVLYCDGDLLFRQPVTELFDAEDALLCCGDHVFLKGQRRDAATFAPLVDPALAGAADTLDRTFNDGFLLIDAGLVEERHYAGLLAMLTPETWRGTDTLHTKQFLQNRYFAGRQTLIGSTYNYLLASAALVQARTGLAPADAKVLHFNMPAKPWMTDAMLGWADPDRDVPVPAFNLWYDAYVDCLTSAHLRAARPTLGTGPPVAGGSRPPAAAAPRTAS